MPGVKIVWVMKVKAVLVLLVLQSQGSISLLQLLKLREKGVSLFKLLLSALDSRHAITIGTDFLGIDHFRKFVESASKRASRRGVAYGSELCCEQASD